MHKTVELMWSMEGLYKKSFSKQADVTSRLHHAVSKSTNPKLDGLERHTHALGIPGISEGRSKLYRTKLNESSDQSRASKSTQV
jgi:hypothetical protein